MAISVPQNSFTGGEWAPSLWARSDLQKYPTAVKRIENCIIHPHGGASNRAGTYFVGETKFSDKDSRLIPFQFSTVQSYMLEFGDQYMRVFKDGGRVVEAAKNITAIALAATITITSNAHGFLNGQWIILDSIVGPTGLNGKTVVVSDKDTNTFKIKDVDGNYIVGTGMTAYDSGGTAERVYELATTYAEADLPLLKIVQSADVMYVFHPSYAPRKISRTGHTAWTIADITWAPGIAAPVLTSPGGTGSQYVITTVSLEGEESLISNEVTSAPGQTLTWVAVTGADYYNIYQNKNGVYGWLGYAAGTSYLIPANTDPDLEEGAPKARTPFGSAGNYPGVATFFEQRLVPARTNNKPQTIFGSVTGSFENMNVRSPLREDDAYEFTINSQKMNEIRWLVPLDVLIIGTSGGEWRMTSGKNSNGITPTSVDVKPQSQWGVSHIQPIVAGSTILFVDASRRAVRDLMYSLEVDKYTGNNLALLAPHLFESSQIVAWCYQQYPDSIVWCVRDDGVLVGLTYYREQEVWGWHRHETQGLFKDIASVMSNEGDIDTYAIVEREVNDVTRRYVERLAERGVINDIKKDAFFVDCGLTYDGSPVTTITGLDHLEGMAVVALADGNVVSGLTVTNGQITLLNAASTVHVGLAYTAEIETMDFEYPTQEGTVQARIRQISSVILGLKDTRALWIGPSADRLLEVAFRTNEDYGEPIEPFTGDKDQPVEPNEDYRVGSLLLRNTDPVPMTILSLTPQFTHGEN